MKSNKGAPLWVCDALNEICIRRRNPQIEGIAKKLVHEGSLSPLWKEIWKKFPGDNSWDTPESLVDSLILTINHNMEAPTGYPAMSPAQLDTWRKKTQKNAMELLENLKDGYPKIAEAGDETLLMDSWVVNAAISVSSSGRADNFYDLTALINNEQVDAKYFESSVGVVGRFPLILNQLIRWLDYEAAKGHSVTHAATKTAHRNSFVRRLTGFFLLHLGSPKRNHVYIITAMFFDMAGFAAGDIKKIAPANRGGKIPARFMKNLPG